MSLDGVRRAVAQAETTVVTPGEGSRSSAPARRRLGEFLRAKRALLHPEDVGLSPGRRRKTAGLRREEVAALAGVSATWYAWIEQGREIRASPETLAGIGRALRLSPWELDYVSRLVAAPGEVARARPPPAAVQAALEAFLSTVTTSLAMAMDARLDVIAFNPLADRVFAFDAVAGAFGRNHLWRAFMDPARRRLYPEFEEHAPSLVGLFRFNYASHVGDPWFEDLLSALHASPEFERIWRTGEVAPVQYDVRSSLRVPTVGVLRFQSVRLQVAGLADCVLFALVPVEPSARAALAELLEGSLDALPSRDAPITAPSGMGPVSRRRSPR